MRELPLPDVIGRDAFRALVYQFTQDLSFYRELIQNAIDANSPRVDIWLELDDDGHGISHIQDFGEGMDRRVIDEELTRLFYSSKQDDLTKIGKFGVGFVSVFAVAPDAVVVDTARQGQAWRLIFKPNGQFDRIRLDEATEGTHVRVVKSMTRREFADWTTRSRATIDYWCRYCSVDINFNEERINQPFDIEAAVKIRRTEQGSEVVAAIVPPGEERFGFYRGGITLWEGTDARLIPGLASPDWLKGVAFRINSRYLEHTLSRDSVRSDPQFEKAMKILRKAVTVDLMDAMYRTLTTRPDHAECAEAVIQTLSTTGKSIRWIPSIGNGSPVSLADLKAAPTADLLSRLGLPAAAEPVVFWSREVTPVTDILQRLKVPVLAHQSLVEDALKSQGFRLEDPSARLIVPQVIADSAASSHQRNLLAATLKLLKGGGVKVPGGGFGRWSPAEVPCAPMPGPEGVVAIGANVRRPVGFLLHDQHPLVERLALLGQSDMASASSLMARAVCLCLGLGTDMDTQFLTGFLRA